MCLIENESKKPYFNKLMKKVMEEYNTKVVYPPYSQLFNAFKLCPIKKLKVVILGQDPYHNPNQANGLAFSVPKGQALPASLRNIYKELSDDLSINNQSGDLTNWAKQGVLLFNTSFSVEAHKANSHHDLGWEELTINIMKELDVLDQPIIFILWGKQAQKYSDFITNPHHKCIKSAHPSPLSAHRGFFGSKPFSKVNQFLEKNHLEKVDWSA